MLNSDINVLSSEFMVMSSALGNKPQYYNVSPSRTIGGPTLSNIGRTYTSPVRTTNIGPPSYWDNPNHINLSPTKINQPAYYNVSNNISSPNIYKGSAYVSPSFGNTQAYSPSRYNPPPIAPNYAPPISVPSK